jgi:hypothetical protein
VLRLCGPVDHRATDSRQSELRRRRVSERTGPNFPEPGYVVAVMRLMKVNISLARKSYVERVRGDLIRLREAREIYSTT